MVEPQTVSQDARTGGSCAIGEVRVSSICLRICFYFPLLVLKGIYHYWKWGLKQMEGFVEDLVLMLGQEMLPERRSTGMVMLHRIRDAM